MSELKTKDETESMHFRKELKKQGERIVKDLKKSKGWLKVPYHWITVKLFRGPIPEISHNWLIVYACALRTEKYLEENYPTDKEKIETLATILAYQEMARVERNFANAWSYVNMAMSLLPLVASDNEVKQCKFFMSVSEKEEQAPDSKTKKVILDSIELLLEVGFNPKDKQKIDECREHILKKLDFLFFPKPAAGEKKSKDSQEEQSGAAPGQESKGGNTDDKRYQLYEERLNDTQKWNRHNRQVSLKLSLWRSLGYIMFFALLLAIILAEVLHELLSTPSQLYFYPFLYISILGFFGGGLSAYIKERETVVSIPNNKLIRMHTFLRMIIGAAGAFVVFIAVRLLKIDEALKLDLLTNIYAFLGLGIASGFSERLFVGALEKISDNLNILAKEESDTPAKDKKEETEEGK